MSQNDQHQFRDGQIVVYRREDSPYFQMRLKVSGHNGPIIRSTKCRSLNEALVVATNTYDDLRYKVQHGLEVKPQTFATMWKRWHAAHANIIAFHRMKYVKGTAERYLLPYFGEMSLGEINNAKVQGY